MELFLNNCGTTTQNNSSSYNLGADELDAKIRELFEAVKNLGICIIVSVRITMNI